MTVLILRVLKLCLNIVYFFVKLLPTKNKIVMISRQSNNVNSDFRLLGNELENKYKVVYLCKTLDGGIKSNLKTRISYGLNMFVQMYHLATSKVCVLDSYCPTVSMLKHKKSLVIVQMWHSVGTMKKFGYTSLGKKEGSFYEIAKVMNMHQNYNMILCSGEAYREHLALGFNVDRDIIKILTLPRIDLLKNKEYEKEVKDKIYEKYPQLKEKQNIIYAPTFRKNESKFNKYLNKLVDEIDKDKYNIVLKLHPLSKVKIKNQDNIIYDRDFSTFDMLFVADKVVSDYSCIVYEAGVRDIPLYFYNYDFDDYIDARGLALDYNELPGYTEKDPKKLVKDFDKKYDMKYLKKFMKKYVENTDDCAKKVAKEIENYMK